MVDVNLTGAFGGPLQALKELICDCPAWQSWTGVSGEDDPATAAEAHVHLISSLGSDWTRPAALVHGLQNLRLTSNARGTSVGFPVHVTGTLNVDFEAEIPSAYADDPEQAALWMFEKVDTLIAQMATRSGGDGYLIVQEFGPSDEILVARNREGEGTEYLRWTWVVRL